MEYQCSEKSARDKRSQRAPTLGMRDGTSQSPSRPRSRHNLAASGFTCTALGRPAVGKEMDRWILGFLLGDSTDNVRKRIAGLECDAPKLKGIGQFKRTFQDCFYEKGQASYDQQTMQRLSTALFSAKDAIFGFKEGKLAELTFGLEGGNISEIVSTMKSLYGTPRVKILEPKPSIGFTLRLTTYRWSDQKTSFEVMHSLGTNIRKEKVDSVSVFLTDRRAISDPDE